MLDYIVQDRTVDDTVIIYEVIRRDGNGNNFPIVAYLNRQTSNIVAARLNRSISAEYEPPVRTKQFNQHANEHGSWCRWSGCAVTVDSRMVHCPAGCTTSAVI